MGLFDRMLMSSDPEGVLSSELDQDVRDKALRLWRHHVCAARENYLGEPLEFTVAPVFQQGQVLLNRFRIERQLGSGGMGEVYLAWDQSLHDRVALKTIAPLLSYSQSIRQRFTTEVQNARRVTHPNVCRIHELFEDGEIVFFSMEYLEGSLLSSVVANPPDYKTSRAIVKQMAQGLHAAHQIGVVHGDFKPSNVMIVPPAGGNALPRAVIMDFGLARSVDRSGIVGDTGLSFRAGTGKYMAPELEGGSPPTVLSDIFAFGKVANELSPSNGFWQECTRPKPEDRLNSLEKIIQRLDGRKSRRYWLGGSAVALAALARYTYMPPIQKNIVLPANARILVNGFRSLSDQLTGARLTRSLMITALQESPLIRVVSDEDILPTLRRLREAGTLPLSGPALVNLLSHIRAGFWIDGELHHSAERYSLDVRLIESSAQRIVAASSVRDAPSIIALAQTAARWVRQTAGESNQSMAINPTDVAAYTSAVPEALQKYFDAMEYYAVGEMENAVPLLEEAIRLDPQFAQAHNMLALTINAARRYDEGFREIEVAMNLAKKLPERERISIETNYYRMTQDPAKMLEAAQQNLAYHPDEPRCHGILGQTLAVGGNPSEAVTSFRNALNLAPDDWMQILFLEDALVEAGDFNQALSEFQLAQARGVPNKWIYNGAGAAYMGLERYDDAIRAFSTEPMDSENTADIQSARIMQGHLRVSIAAMEEQRASARNPVEAHEANEFLCGLHFVTDQPDAGLPNVREMANLPSYPPMARSLACTASWARRLGAADALAKVRASTAEISHNWPNALTQAVALHSAALEAWQNLAYEDAERLLLRSSGLAFGIWTLFDLADLYTHTSKWELAEAYWQRFEGRRGTILVDGSFPGIFVLSWLYRALAAQRRNDRILAFEYSRKVLDHWSQSNSQLQIVLAAQDINNLSKPS